MDRGMICRDWEILAFLDHRKTQFRLPLRPQPTGDEQLHLMAWDWPSRRVQFGDNHGPQRPCHAPVWSGDRIYMQEPFILFETVGTEFGGAPYEMNEYWGTVPKEPRWQHDGGPGLSMDFRATCEDPQAISEWRPSAHMPPWASRLWYDVVKVRVERVNQMRYEDAIAEGVCEDPDAYEMRYKSREWFQELWDHHYTARGRNLPFASGPWVWLLDLRETISPIQDGVYCHTGRMEVTA